MRLEEFCTRFFFFFVSFRFGFGFDYGFSKSLLHLQSSFALHFSDFTLENQMVWGRIESLLVESDYFVHILIFIVDYFLVCIYSCCQCSDSLFPNPPVTQLTDAHLNYVDVTDAMHILLSLFKVDLDMVISILCSHSVRALFQYISDMCIVHDRLFVLNKITKRAATQIKRYRLHQHLHRLCVCFFSGSRHQLRLLERKRKEQRRPAPL